MRKLHIYFFQTASGPIKVGIAYDVGKRLKIAETFNHEEITKIGSFPGNSKIEKFIHTKFDKHRIRGEWFRNNNELVNLARGIFDLDCQRDGNKFYPVLWRDYINSSTDACPFCFRKHSHGEGDGYRHAHCTRDYGFSVIETTSAHSFRRDDGYIVKSRKQQKITIAPPTSRFTNKARLNRYKKLLMLAFNSALSNRLFSLSGDIFISDSNRAVKWLHNDYHVCKALFSNLGYGEIGISVLFCLSNTNWDPVAFPDYRDSRHCEAWASGIYNFKSRSIIFNDGFDNLTFYCSKSAEFDLDLLSNTYSV